jgi:ubiquinone/menaquinone biosynthesis C-methylase UbiE
MTKKLKNNVFENYWHDQANAWAQSIREGKDIFRDFYSLPAFIEFIGNINGKHVLDVGCGEGSNTRTFAKLGAHITGVDLAENMIRIAQEEESKKPLGITYHKASWTDLSVFDDKTFDIVLSTMALMDGPEYEKGLQEFYRVLQDNGSLFFSVTHPCFLPPYYSKLTDEQGITTHRVVSNYFKEGPWTFEWALAKENDKTDAQPVTSIAYHRTMATYINNVISSGFILKAIKEPRPSEQACQQHPRLRVAHEVAPSFLFLHAIKPKI